MLNTENKIGVLNSSDSHLPLSTATNRDIAPWYLSTKINAAIANKIAMGSRGSY